jgi:O-antigen chain-terminating methyltransferase
MSQEDQETIEALVARLRDRVAERRQAGAYPPDLEAALDSHFRRVSADRAAVALVDTEARLAELTANTAFDRNLIGADSNVPGGALLHRAVAKAVSRQVEGVLQQVREFADGVRDVLQSIVIALEDPTGHEHADLVGQIDAIYERLAAMEKGPTGADGAIADIRRRVDALEEADRRRSFRPWFTNAAFEDAFRGDATDLRERYRGLAGRLHNCAPVLDIGCGRGEFLDLLREEGIPASGVEIDPELVAECVRQDLAVELGDGLAVLASQPDGSLGGISLIQVVEHLTPQQVLELLSLAIDKLRPGGRMVVETINPLSLYVFAHSFYVDPTHATPIHPAYLEFLFREIGFAEVLVEWRSPPPEGDMLEEPGDGGVGDANVRRLNRLLFAEQDYAIIATR